MKKEAQENRNRPFIPAEPLHAYNQQTADRLLSVAETYLENAEKLIYSYGSRTFLSGYDLYDEDYAGRGNIDCSTFLLLVLAGIPYEKSPYAAGTVRTLRQNRAAWANEDLTGFADLPERYIGIAERIGRPYLAGPKGLDLEKAAALGISAETLGEEIRATGVGRRSVQIAQYYLERGACFTGREYAMPGDIVFYRNSGFFKDGGKRFRARAEITHVGIISLDRELKINSAGYVSKERAEREGLPAVALAPVLGKRTPAFFARPAGQAFSSGEGGTPSGVTDEGS